MRKILLILVFATLSIPVFAGTKILKGTLKELANTKEIPVYVNWDKTQYAQGGSLKDFLRTCKRDRSWEEESLEYFICETNASTLPYGKSLVMPEEAPKYEYKIEIYPTKIHKNGCLEGSIVVFKKDDYLPSSVIYFISDDYDDDDEIAFKDQFESIGESFGKLLVKQLKKK